LGAKKEIELCFLDIKHIEII